LKRDLVTEAGSAVVVRGPSAHSEELASRLLTEGYSVVMLKAV
jgi:hypothetical protein